MTDEPLYPPADDDETDAPYDGELDIGPAGLRSLLDAAAGHVVEHLATLPEQPVSNVAGAAELARSLREPLPENGRPAGELLDLVFRRALARTYNTASPGYLAYIPGGGLPQAAVASFIANAVNRYAGVWIAAPGLAEIESNVVRWFCRIVGYPEHAFGILTSGGSLANLSGIAAARTDRLGDHADGGVLYVADQVHHSIFKAARLCGFARDAIRTIPSDGAFRLAPSALDEAVRSDIAVGRRPFLVVASAGTTNSGAVDDLAGLADVAARHRLWLHVDAAYGGFFALTARGRRALRGLERADSIVLDPHKGLFLPYGTGCLLVRERDTLRAAHGERADYMPTLQGDDEHADFCELSPELSRPWRGLSAWLPLAMHGAGAFRRCLDEKLDLAREAAGVIEALPGLELVARPELSLVAFRVRTEGGTGTDNDEATRQLLRTVNSRQRVFLTGTTLRGRFTARICVLSFRTRADRMAMALEDLRAALHEVRSARGGSA